MSALALKYSGWRFEGQVPDVPKCVVVVAPHTSNWDLPLAILFAFAYRIPCPVWVAKHTIFRWPFGAFCRWFGGIPVDRSAAHNVVLQIVQHFNGREKIMFGITPEGTRKRAKTWKRGFHHIARGAGVPISLAYLDYKRKVGGFGPLFMPSDDVTADVKRVGEFYSGVTPRYPELTGPPMEESGN